MSDTDPDRAARSLAAQSLADDDPTGWFERLYTAAERDEAVVPWDRGAPHQMLAEWVERQELRGDGRRALVVGSGFGRDSEFIAGLGFDTVAFDISESAIRETRRRFPESPVHYLTADLLEPPADWPEAFDLVVESMTVQALPDSLRPQAISAVPEMVAPGGTLIVIAAARDENEPTDGPPWPLTRAEIDAFAGSHLKPVRVEDVRDDALGMRRWRAEFRHPSGPA